MIKKTIKRFLKSHGFEKLDDNKKYELICNALNTAYEENRFSILIKDSFGIITERETNENWRFLLENRVSNDANLWMSVFKDMIPAGKLAVDVGGAIGITPIYFSKLYDIVDAYEPILGNQVRFKKNLVLNNVTNVRLIPKALSNICGKQFMNEYESFGHHSLGDVFDAKSNRVEVGVSTLDAEYYKKSCIDLLKLDIEGYELEALLGAKNLLKEGMIRCIIIENSPQLLRRRGIESKTIFEILNGSGFSIYDFNKNRVTGFGSEQGDYICLKS